MKLMNDNESQKPTSLTMEQQFFLASKRQAIEALDIEQLKELSMFLLENDLRKHNATVALVHQLMFPNESHSRPDTKER